MGHNEFTTNVTCVIVFYFTTLAVYICYFRNQTSRSSSSLDHVTSIFFVVRFRCRVRSDHPFRPTVHRGPENIPSDMFLPEVDYHPSCFSALAGNSSEPSPIEVWHLIVSARQSPLTHVSSSLSLSLLSSRWCVDPYIQEPKPVISTSPAAPTRLVVSS